MKSAVLSAVFKVLKKNLSLTVPLVVIVIFSIVFALIPPLALEAAVDSLAEGRLNVALAFLYFGALLLSCLSDSAREIFLTFVGQKITRAVRLMMVEKLDRLPARYFTDNESGRVASLIINDVESLDSLFKSGIISTFVDVGKIVGILVVLFTKSWGIGLLMALLTPVLAVITFKFKNKIRASQIKNKRAVASVNNHINETMGAMRTIRNLGRQRYFADRYGAFVDQSYKALETNSFYEAIYTPIINQVAVTVVCLVFVLGAIGGGFLSVFGLGVGTAVAVIDYIFNIFTPIENLGMEIQNVQSAMAAVKRIDEFMTADEREVKLDKVVFDFNAPAVTFENVTFGYNKGENVLENVSFTVDKGELVTVAGRTGAGKTTSLKLILGFEKPFSGQVKVFGVNACDVPDEQKRSLFGYIEQSARMIDGTVKEQITLGEDFTDEQVERVCEIVGIADYIKGFALGYDEVYKEGMFSKGQLQLISVARAVIAEPKILLLDEITAHLDSETERKVVGGIIRAAKGRTFVSISHRINNRLDKMRIIGIGKDG